MQREKKSGEKGLIGMRFAHLDLRSSLALMHVELIHSWQLFSASDVVFYNQETVCHLLHHLAPQHCKNRNSQHEVNRECKKLTGLTLNSLPIVITSALDPKPQILSVVDEQNVQNDLKLKLL